MTLRKKQILKRRASRVRQKLKANVKERALRLSVARSSKHISAQLIDDSRGHTLVSASSLEKEARAELKNGATVEAALFVGKLLAQRALESSLKSAYFDRGAYLYHGRVRAVAEGAREGGLVL
jgi:large subunit ribosomal protein L18